MDELKERVIQLINWINTRSLKTKKIVLIIFVLIVFYGIFRIPAIYTRVNNQWAELSARITYFFNPPEKAVFVPQEQFQIALVVQATLAAMTQEAESESESGPIPTETQIPEGFTPLPTVAFTPTISPTPLPQRVVLEDVIYVDQQNRYNYCGPANITMALNYWGWDGNRDQVAMVIKPGKNDPELSFIDRGRSDVNVMPYELSSYVRDNTYYNALLRVGGDMDLLKNLISNGFPVVIEKGYYARSYISNSVEWMGHYLFVTGYDDQVGAFIVQDAYLEPGESIESDYVTFMKGWHSFNYTFIVVYPPDKETELFEVLGPWGSVNWANQHALDLAEQDIANYQNDMKTYYSWFNKGSSHVALDQYQDAAIAYDYSFLLYSQLDDENNQRPYRMMWYQVGPYWAYYYTERYNDLINLANTTLNDTIANPILEESLYWRGMAYLSEDRYQDAVDDFREAVYLNPNYSPGISILTQLGEDLND